MVVASDAMTGLCKDGKLRPWDAKPSEYYGHPCTSISYSMTLNYVRERGLLSLNAAVGVQSVLVNGELIVGRGELIPDAAPGQPIRRAVRN